MEMHHKLRRDPNWHPNGCNLCGQVCWPSRAQIRSTRAAKRAPSKDKQALFQCEASEIHTG